MRYGYITFRSITFAQRGQRALQHSGIESAMLRTPGVLSERGCGYCLRMRPKELERAIWTLRDEQAAFSRVLVQHENGELEEREI